MDDCRDSLNGGLSFAGLQDKGILGRDLPAKAANEATVKLARGIAPSKRYQEVESEDAAQFKERVLHYGASVLP